MRYRGAHRLPEWLEAGATVLRDNRTDDIQEAVSRIDKPICLEVGCGKGGFLQKMAQLYPDHFFIGIDRVSAVLAKGAAGAARSEIANILYVIGDIAYIAPKWTDVTVDRIFLNFSDPWPRRRHHDRRLTHASKLSLYQTLLGSTGVLEQKTDNRDLFEWSVSSFEANGWQLCAVERDFAAGEPDLDTLSSQYVQTEYEAKFRARANPIYYLRAKPPVD